MMMTTLFRQSVFIDTNILTRYDIAETPEHHRIVAAFHTLHSHECRLWISRQVIREYCRTLTHPAFTKPMEMPEAVKRIRNLMPVFYIANENERVTQYFLTLLETIPIGGKQVHDANIVATMQSKAITHLVTLNVEDFKRFENVITIITLDDLL